MLLILGIVIFTGFNGANGHTIIIKNNNYEYIYSHVSPNYIIKPNDIISPNQIIGFVGPKYLIIGNEKYTDSSGKFTNGATTGTHLHLTIKNDGIAVDPLLFYDN